MNDDILERLERMHAAAQMEDATSAAEEIRKLQATVAGYETAALRPRASGIRELLRDLDQICDPGMAARSWAPHIPRIREAAEVIRSYQPLADWLARIGKNTKPENPTQDRPEAIMVRLGYEEGEQWGERGDGDLWIYPTRRDAEQNTDDGARLLRRVVLYGPWEEVGDG